MEQATLRPVPLRPSGPVDPAEALAYVRASLPELDEAAAHALALVEIAGRTRPAAGGETGLATDELTAALARARKALRRSMFPLSASGWCERAERLLSDRIDGVLKPPGPARLDVHLRNCERCVDHERKLSHARDRLVRAFIAAHPHAEAAGPAERPRAAELRVIEAATVEQPAPEVWTGPTRVVPGFGGPVVEPLRDGAVALPAPCFAGPGGETEPKPAPPDPDEPMDPPNEATIAPAEPADATPSEHDAETADPLVPVDEPAALTEHPDASVAASLAWGTLTWLSVGLAVFALVVTLLAIVGLQRIF